MGVHREALAPAFAAADAVWIYAPADLGWDVQGVVAALGDRGHLRRDLDTLSADLVPRIALRRPCARDEQWQLRGLACTAPCSPAGAQSRRRKCLSRLSAGEEICVAFRLHTVLFPGGPLPLRIFEPRYIDMVRRSLRAADGLRGRC